MQTRDELLASPQSEVQLVIEPEIAGLMRVLLLAAGPQGV